MTAGGSPPNIRGSFGGAPHLVQAWTQEIGGAPTVTLTFNCPTNGYAVSVSNADSVLALSNSHSWGQIVSAAWSSGFYWRFRGHHT